MPKNVTDSIKETEYFLAKFRFIESIYPDAKVHFNYDKSVYFSSKAVNKDYTKLAFRTHTYAIYVAPYSELIFSYNGKDEIIKIVSQPKSSRLAYIDYGLRDNKRVLKFSRLSFNLKNNSFKDSMLNDCRVKIMEFVKAHPNLALDTKHLEPRLKKLLSFT